MLIQANAKINLALNVIGKRDDGYHELDMIMIPLQLHDDIEISLAKEDKFTSDDKTVAMDTSNTVVKAVNLMRDTFQLKDHFHIQLHKRIPSQAGLAGGSADGAAVLRGIWKLCNIDISIEELAQLGKKIGADVPFCVLNQCCIVQGIGDRLIPFSLDWKPHVLLVKPNVGVSTKEAYETLDYTACAHPDVAHIKQLLETNQFSEVYQHIGNSLENSAFKLAPEIKMIKEELIEIGFTCVLMSGSGSCVFAISEDEQFVKKAVQHYQNMNVFVCNTSFL